jgi:hypothetical protein
MEKRRERLNGLLLREPYMAFNLQKLIISSLRRAATESCLRLLNRPRGELRLQGKSVSILLGSLIQSINT